MTFTTKTLRRIFRRFIAIGKFIIIACKQLFLMSIGDKLHTPIFSPIRSFSDLSKELDSSVGRRYIIKSFRYGQEYGCTPIQSHVFRSFLLVSLRVTYFRYFDRAVSRFIHSNKISKEKLFLDDPVFILPYYNTQFGHYTGELLGQFLMYESLMKPNSERRLLIVRGCCDSDNYIDKFCSKNNVKYVESDLLLSNNLYLNNAVCLPLVHPWQGINFLKNKIIKSYVYSSDICPGVFLTTSRRERIENIDDVILFFESKGFAVIKSQDTFSEESLSLIKNSDICVTEDGTISHFVLLHRSRNYYTLSPASPDYSRPEYFGGYVFNEFDIPRRIPVECEIVSISNKHIMSSQIRVDIGRLNDLISH